MLFLSTWRGYFSPKMVGKRIIRIINGVRSLRSSQELFNETPSSDGGFHVEIQNCTKVLDEYKGRNRLEWRNFKFRES